MCAVCMIASTFSVVFSTVKIPQVTTVIDITILSQLIDYSIENFIVLIVF